MTPIEASKSIEEKLTAASGKPVLVQRDPNCSGHASINIASADDAAHVLRYKPAFEPELPYLTAFQCGLALRTINATPTKRFDLTSMPNLQADVQRLVSDHLDQSKSNIPAAMVPQLVAQFANGLGLQLRSMPVAIRVDAMLFDDYPSLRPLQRSSIERQLQEAMQALGPVVKAIAPKVIVDANVGMSTAFAKFWAKCWGEPQVALPFIAAGYNEIGNQLISLIDSIPNSPDADRELVESWINQLQLGHWFRTINRK